MRKRTLRYVGTEISSGMWISLPLQHSEVVADYFLTPQVSQGQKSSSLPIAISSALYSCKPLFGLHHLTIPISLSLSFCSHQQFFYLSDLGIILPNPSPVIFLSDVNIHIDGSSKPLASNSSLISEFPLACPCTPA